MFCVVRKGLGGTEIGLEIQYQFYSCRPSSHSWDFVWDVTGTERRRPHGNTCKYGSCFNMLRHTSQLFANIFSFWKINCIKQYGQLFNETPTHSCVTYELHRAYSSIHNSRQQNGKDFVHKSLPSANKPIMGFYSHNMHKNIAHRGANLCQ
jgi:hypothetical protein